MRKFYWIVLVVFLTGCAEQPPVQVVEAVPSTYKILPSIKLKNSHVAFKIHPPHDTREWAWPVKGNILSRFSRHNTKFKGIDIGGIEGAPVLAAGSGEVVYSGNSLDGYGNLIIIKHKKNFLTAYAHNRKNMVKEGDTVIIGQRIAEMGRSGTDKVKLHFEVRQDGTPIDPQTVLPSRN